MKTIKIAHIVEDLKTGGLEKVIYHLALGLDSNRYDVRVWCLCGGGETAEELKKHGAKVEILGMGSRCALSFLWRLRQKIKKEKIDIIHTHGITANSIGRIAGILAGVPAVFAHLHTYYPEGGLKQKIISRFADFQSNRIICCCRFVADFVIRHTGINQAKIQVIYNGVPAQNSSIPPLSRLELKTRDDDFVIGCAASLTAHKGHRYLIEAVKEVKAKFPAVKVLLMGTGPLREELEKHCRSAGVSDNVIFLGNRKDMCRILPVIDVFALPSCDREGFPMSILEAMSCGKPVIASAIGGIPESVELGVTGLLVPPGDSHAIAQALISLIENRDLMKNMGAEGLKRFEKLFKLDTMIEEISALYETIRVTTH